MTDLVMQLMTKPSLIMDPSFGRDKLPKWEDCPTVAWNKFRNLGPTFKNKIISRKSAHLTKRNREKVEDKLDISVSSTYVTCVANIAQRFMLHQI